MRLEELRPGVRVRGILPDALVEVVGVQWHGSDAVTLVYRAPDGWIAEELVYRDDEGRLEGVGEGPPWSFDGDGEAFRLVAEAQRIRLAYLFDPHLAIHTSLVEPLPHQITAVYEAMLPRQPLRFLLADDPGAGKTIMAGLLIKELIARGDLQRCLIVCPGPLAEQWQDEMDRRFHLCFTLLTNEALWSARTGNWFLENDFVIAGLDKLARDEEAKKLLKNDECNYDLIVVDEAHKMSASYSGRKAKPTKRYQLGQLLSEITRHFLLITATPHNGKEEDFQLFMALLDPDRFAGGSRRKDGHEDVSDLMRRMVKEDLRKLDGRPLFPERVACTIPYELSGDEARLYEDVTNYVREEWGRAERLRDRGRKRTVSFALTLLQRRLASSPAAIHESLQRRRVRLEEQLHRMARLPRYPAENLTASDLTALEDVPDDTLPSHQQDILDLATAAETVAELESEVATLVRLESLAKRIRRRGEDTKWRQLSDLLQYLLSDPSGLDQAATPYGTSELTMPKRSSHQKIVVFTEFLDTLHYLEDCIIRVPRGSYSFVSIHGRLSRKERREAQEAFLHDPKVQILLATDAAGEGVNLQRAHLMVNYDLPWNPNRLEQRFGRIHRIGQTDVCHLWNLVTANTREGDVYLRLLEKLEEARKALGGKVYDVLGRLQFQGRSLVEILKEAIRDGEKPDVRAHLEQAIEDGVDRRHILDLVENRALAHEVMDTCLVARVRGEIERAEARRLQAHYIESFFLKAFRRLRGTIRESGPRCYEITRVPDIIRKYGHRRRHDEPILQRYGRVVFEKGDIDPLELSEAAPATFVYPGHPLLETVIDLTLEQHRGLLSRGAILVDETDTGTTPRVMFAMEHSILSGHVLPSGGRRTVSKRMLYVEIDATGRIRNLQYPPYLDFRPLRKWEPDPKTILSHPACSWIRSTIEDQVLQHAIQDIAPRHMKEVRGSRLRWIEKTRAAVRERLTKEIAYWDRRARQLKGLEDAGKAPKRLNSKQALEKVEKFERRLEDRMAELARESQLSAAPPTVTGRFVVVPRGLLVALTGEDQPLAVDDPTDSTARARQAQEAIMQVEQALGNEIVGLTLAEPAYDIESLDPKTGRLRFLKVKIYDIGTKVITFTRNEILACLNKPDQYILALVEFREDDRKSVRYLYRPFERKPDFSVAHIDYELAELLARAEEPR